MTESENGHHWRISSFSGMQNCVQVAAEGAGIHVRQSKSPEDMGVSFTNDEWRAFIAGVKAGEFDLTDEGLFSD